MHPSGSQAADNLLSMKAPGIELLSGVTTKIIKKDKITPEPKMKQMSPRGGASRRGSQERGGRYR